MKPLMISYSLTGNNEVLAEPAATFSLKARKHSQWNG